LYFLFPSAEKIEYEIEIVSPAEMCEETSSVVLGLKNKLKKVFNSSEVVVFVPIPYSYKYQVPPIVSFDIPGAVLERDRFR
jgi:hypothetical protein